MRIDLRYPLAITEQPQQVLVMGFFDGVHRGHQQVLKTAKKIADERGLELAVLTYDPHPAVVFEKFDAPLTYLTTVDKKVALLTQYGAQRVYVMNFTSQLAALPPQVFVDDVLMALNPVVVVAGFDHTYGAEKTVSDMATLPQYAKKRFDVVAVPAFPLDGPKVASRDLRAALAVGDVDLVNADLGRIYETTGLVVHGEARGRELGFPTANIQTPMLERLPGIGIYAVEIQVGGIWYQAMASIGRNVTFGDGRPVTVEINILNFNQAIYGEHVVVRWCHYLRGEVKFTGAPALIEQLKQDQQATEAWFAARS